MTPEKLREAMAFAKAFTAAAEAAIKRIEEDGYNVGTLQSGAARRASLDLTRCLAKLRNPHR